MNAWCMQLPNLWCVLSRRKFMMATVKTLYSASFTTNNYSCLQALNWATHEESRKAHTIYHTTTYYFEEKSFTLTSFQKSCIFSSKNHFSLFYHFSHGKRSVAIWTLFIIKHRCAAESSCLKWPWWWSWWCKSSFYKKIFEKGEKKCFNEFKRVSIQLSSYLIFWSICYVHECVYAYVTWSVKCIIIIFKN